jgi:hypothetical protein
LGARRGDAECGDREAEDHRAAAHHHQHRHEHADRANRDGDNNDLARIALVEEAPAERRGHQHRRRGDRGDVGRADRDVAAAGAGASGMEATAAPRPVLRWADLLRRVYDIDRRTCPNCGLGTLEPIASILDPDAIARILDAISRRSRAPPP